MAFGNAATALQGITASTVNVSALASVMGMYVGTYHQRHFIGNDIRTSGLIASLPFLGSVVGLQVQNYGMAGWYSDLSMGMAYARSFGGRFAVGTRANLHQIHIPRYANSHTYSIDLGMQYKVDSLWCLGLAFGNLSQSSHPNEMHAQLPARASVGATYRLSQELLVGIDYVRLIDERGQDVRFGLEYAMGRVLALRGGTALNPLVQFTGIGLAWQKFKLDFSTSVHQQLGLSPQLFLGYAL